MTESWHRRACRVLLRRAVRGRAERGGEWGEAMLAEYEEMTGWAAVRWAVSGARLALRQRHRSGGRLRRSRRILGSRRGRVGLAVLAGVVLSLTTSQAVALAYVPSPGMAPTLRIGDRLLVDEVSFRVTGLAHGDVILYTWQGERFSKRVIGLPGDRIHCDGGAVYRNGVRVAEPYLAPGTVTSCEPVTVPDDTLYVLGDAREMSADSRQYGVVPAGDVTGRMLTSFRLPFSAS